MARCLRDLWRLDLRWCLRNVCFGGDLLQWLWLWWGWCDRVARGPRHEGRGLG